MKNAEQCTVKPASAGYGANRCLRGNPANGTPRTHPVQAAHTACKPTNTPPIAADDAAASHNALANLVRRTAGVTPDMAVRLGAYMTNDPDGDEFWLRMQMAYDLWHARTRLKAEVAKIEPAAREPKESASAA